MYTLPKDPKIATKWIEFLKSQGLKKLTFAIRICDEHFTLDEKGFRADIPSVITTTVSLLNKISGFTFKLKYNFDIGITKEGRRSIQSYFESN